MNRKYQDLINKPRPKPIKEPMSIQDRAAQFAPFAALDGHKEQIQESQRTTQDKKILDENLKQEIDQKLQETLKNIKNKPKVKITHFEKDKYKKGGQYKTIEKTLVKHDPYNKILIFSDKTYIYIQDIIQIEQI